MPTGVFWAGICLLSRLLEAAPQKEKLASGCACAPRPTDRPTNYLPFGLAKPTGCFGALQKPSERSERNRANEDSGVGVPARESGGSKLSGPGEAPPPRGPGVGAPGRK